MKEQEVIKRLNFHKEYARLSSNRVVISETDIETVLNMLKEKDKEIEKKDKQIDLMALAIINYDDQLVINRYKNINEVKQCFERKVRE